MGAKKKKVASRKTEANFKEGDLVGAKIKGYPLWPAIIERMDINNPRRKFTIRFFGSDELYHSFTQIKLFKDFTPQERACARKGFKEALELCQKEYDSLRAAHEGEEDEEGEQEEDEEMSEGRLKDSEIPPTEASALDSSTVAVTGAKGHAGTQKVELVNPDQASSLERIESPTKFLDQLQSDPTSGVAKEKSPKPEVENAIDATVRDTALQKLREKVAKKLKEKEARKNQAKESKLSSKVSLKLGQTNKYLDRFAKVLRVLSNAQPLDQNIISEWNASYPAFNGALEVLSRCLSYFLANHIQMSSQTDCRRCYETLVKVVEHLRAAKKNKQVPKEIREEIEKCMHGMKQQKIVKKFINSDEFGSLKNAMIERRDNE